VKVIEQQDLDSRLRTLEAKVAEKAAPQVMMTDVLSELRRQERASHEIFMRNAPTPQAVFDAAVAGIFTLIQLDQSESLSYIRKFGAHGILHLKTPALRDQVLRN
jgi:hypothetical protein